MEHALAMAEAGAMADQLKEETDKLLDSVLYTRSMEMKNGFHMSDF